MFKQILKTNQENKLIVKLGEMGVCGTDSETWIRDERRIEPLQQPAYTTTQT